MTHSRKRIPVRKRCSVAEFEVFGFAGIHLKEALQKGHKQRADHANAEGQQIRRKGDKEFFPRADISAEPQRKDRMQ